MKEKGDRRVGEAAGGRWEGLERNAKVNLLTNKSPVWSKTSRGYRFSTSPNTGVFFY